MIGLLAKVSFLFSAILVQLITTTLDYPSDVAFSLALKHIPTLSPLDLVYRKHRDVLHLNSSSVQPESASQDPSTICDNPLDHVSLYSHNINDLQTNATCGINLQLSAAKFLLQIKEECKLTQASVNKIVSSVRGLWSEAMCNVRERLKQDTIVNIDESIFDDTLFDGLETQHLQEKYYKEHFSRGIIHSSVTILCF